MKNKILIVSRNFPPANGGGVQRIVKFGKYLQELGWNVTICTIDGENFSWIDKTRLKEVDGLSTIRIKEKPYKNRFIDKVINKFRFYDFQIGWTKRVISYFSNTRNFDYDYVLTSGPPHSVHYLGIKLKSRYNFFWISDFRDPYTLGAFYKPITAIHKTFQKKFEQNIYNKSDLILTNTKTNAGELFNSFVFKTKDKVKTIYNGYDLNDLSLNGQVYNYDVKKINLVYLGGLRGDNVDGFFYKVLKLVKDKDLDILKSIKIHVIGDISRKGGLIESLGLSEFFNLIGPVAYNKVGNYLLNVNGGLTWQNFDMRYSGTIAGKVFDYFGMKKPIFSIGQPTGELDNFINTNNIGVHTNANNIKKAADDFMSFVKNIDSYKKSYENMPLDYFNSFNRKIQVDQLNKYLLELSNS